MPHDARAQRRVPATRAAPCPGLQGPNGEQMKQWVFGRVNWLSNGNGRLDPTQFGNALTVARQALLGY